MQLIAKPVVDLRREPRDIMPKDFSHNDLRESQLLYNERVEVLKQEGEWLFIHATEQGGYPGWIHASEIREVTSFTPRYVVSVPWATSLSFGTFLEAPQEGCRPLEAPFSRKTLVEDLHLFLGAPYLWGGRAAHSPAYPSSCDCSSLVQLVYRAQGISLPRDAYMQCDALTPIEEKKALPGDLVYLTKEERITHVVIVAESGFIDARQTGKTITLTQTLSPEWKRFYRRAAPC